MDEKVIMGWWDGEPIWRYKTAEERLLEAGIDPEVAKLGMVLLGNHETARNLSKSIVTPRGHAFNQNKHD